MKSHSQNVRVRRSRVDFEIVQGSCEEFSMIIIEIDCNVLNWIGVKRKVSLVICDEDTCNVSDLNLDDFWKITLTWDFDCVMTKFLWCFNAILLRVDLDEIFFALDGVLSSEWVWSQGRNPESFSLFIRSPNHMRQQQVDFFEDFDVALCFSNDLVSRFVLYFQRDNLVSLLESCCIDSSSCQKS